MIFWGKADEKIHVLRGNDHLVHDTTHLVLDYVGVKTVTFRDVSVEINRGNIERIALEGQCKVVIHQMDNEYEVFSKKAHWSSELTINNKRVTIFT